MLTHCDSMFQAFSPFGIVASQHGAPPHADIALAFGPESETELLLSAKGAIHISLGQSPRKMAQKLGQG
jgi:hypothetical protein